MKQKLNPQTAALELIAASGRGAGRHALREQTSMSSGEIEASTSAVLGLVQLTHDIHLTLHHPTHREKTDAAL